MHSLIKFKTFSRIIILLLLPNLAFAYVDPGTGVLLWQGLIAAVGVILLLVKRPLLWIKKIFNLFLSGKNHKVEDDK